LSRRRRLRVFTFKFILGEKRVREVKQENEIEMQEVKEAHASALEKAELESKAAIAKAKKSRDIYDSKVAENEAKIAVVKAKIKDDIKEIEDDGEVEVQDITERNQEKSSQLRAQHEKKNVELKASLEKKIGERKKEFEKEMAELEDQHNAQKGKKMQEYSSEFSESEKAKFDKARAAIDEETNQIMLLKARVAQDLEDVGNQAKEIEARKRALNSNSSELTQSEIDMKTRRDRMAKEKAQVSSDDLNLKSRQKSSANDGANESLELERQDKELDLLRSSLKQKKGTVDEERVQLEQELAKITELHKNILKEQEAMRATKLAKPAEVTQPEPQTNTESSMKNLDDLDNLQSNFRSKLADYLQTPTRGLHVEDDYADGEQDENYDSESIVSEIVERGFKRHAQQSRHRSRSQQRKQKLHSRAPERNLERQLFEDDYEYSSSIESDGYYSFILFT
jgi:hypothetical protein